MPQALGLDLWFVEGEGPRLSPVASAEGLRAPQDVHETLAPVYETVRILSRELPSEVALIGFAGAPWTVATYMIAGRGTPDQGAGARADAGRTARPSRRSSRSVEAATVEYLSAQVEAGAEAVKLFDSWAGSLAGEDFGRYAVAPARRASPRRSRRGTPSLPVIAFPRGAGERYEGLHAATGADCIAVDDGVSPEWAAAHVQVGGCVQGNLASRHLVTGGKELVAETRRVRDAFSGGPHVFNLGHGITPDADPDNVRIMLDALRG